MSRCLLNSALVCSVLTVSVGCEDDATTAAALLSGPSGLALAGTIEERLFIANSAEDAVRVLDFSAPVGSSAPPSVNNADFVRAPNVFSPLRIPVGPNPTDLVASDDRRVVAVLDPVGSALRLIDADTLLLVRDEDGEVYTFALGEGGSLPVSLVADPAGCIGSCLGRFFVSLSGLGQVVLLRFEELVADSPEDAAGGFRVALEQIYVTGGRPQRLAATQDGRFVFATDPESDEVIRIDRVTGFVDRRAVGGPPGDIAVAGDGSAVLVARPRFRDVVVMDDIAGGWSL
ncbi:MAG: hypothetical protein AAF658_16045, partial [Myxococcota bacterium]